MQRKVTLTLSPEKRKAKPTDPIAEHHLIQSHNTVTISLEDLANAVSEGQSFCHGVFSGQREKKNFISSDLVVLDIDNKDTDNPLTIEKALERLKEYGLGCNLIYTSFSDFIPKGETDFEILKTAKRYRMVFLLPVTVDKLEALDDLLFNGFYELFPEADHVADVQFWYGGKNIVHTNFEYELDLEVLNSIITIQKTCHLKSDKRRNQKIKEFAAIPFSLMERVENTDAYVLKTANTFIKHKASAKKRTYQNYQTIRNFDWDFATDQFELLDSFLNLKRKIYHLELFFLYLGMRKIEGGAKKWKEAVKNNPKIDGQKLTAIAYYLEKRAELGGKLYEPRISKYAPNDKAATKYDFLTNVSNKLNRKIEVVNEDDLYFMPEPNATSALNYFFTEVKSDFGNGKYVFKCATGLGKTEEIIKCNNLAECIIAVPTHKLKDEISARLKEKEVEHYVLPELPKLPSPIQYDYEALSNIGAYEKASSLLWQVSAGENNSKYFISDEEHQRVRDELRAYFSAVEECQDTTFPVLTTHKKILSTEFPNHSTCIIDEDIMPSLFEVKSTSSKDFRMLINQLKKATYKGAGEDIEQLYKLLAAIDQQFLGEVMDSKILKDMFSSESIKMFVKISTKQGLPMEGSIIGLFTSDYFFVSPKDQQYDRDGDKTIHYLKINSLPQDKKIIVLSATANREMYEHIFGKLEWHEFSQVEQIGNSVQVYDNSFSRAWMNKKENKKVIESVKQLLGDKPVITFKKQANRFANAANFCLESSEGFDELIGQDIAVVGTPHLQIGVYALMATALGIPFSKDDLKLEMVKCEYQNMRFDFFTFKHEGLRKIQFYKIESQLTQACGRSRAIRENVTVHLFSNFPLAGFEKITLAELERRENTEPITTVMPEPFTSGSQAA